MRRLLLAVVLGLFALEAVGCKNEEPPPEPKPVPKSRLPKPPVPTAPGR
jgi:hypothetical protein